ncbi:glycoside hydrolase family 3 protein [Flavihumibacter profundi]|uniref:glycoside hydrolase family 3 protein n=1 Tax=Flavihumibacter profundi TaxID=2716883 RepID=UPI001CC74851|nr:glycoside hydrolase family 3 N-terminal domain-containing protein [Flavihumibacter profundi]MBZ5856828.1 glycoside hydrolase family 3 C-terminal domain-containing protein [Flavihumibacter profundi]
MIRKILKWTGIVLGAIILLLVLAYVIVYIKASVTSKNNMALLGETAKTLTQNGVQFRDLNKNGKLDTYENPTADPESRVIDLISQMSLEEKAGAMFITVIGPTPDGEPLEKPLLTTKLLDLVVSFISPSNSELIARKHMNNFNPIASLDANLMARYNNAIQKMAERTRLGIPITLSSDPRHINEFNPGTTLYTPAFSQWPTTLGLAATRDTALVREFGEIARQEYMSVGIRMALSPMADLATEPRWGRINGTFGEDAGLVSAMVKAYILGFQGDSLGKNSVACMVKHFPGGGAQKGGEVAHFSYGKEQVYPGRNLNYHLLPFKKAFSDANAAQVMLNYGIPMGQTVENVANAFNKGIVTTLLRDSLKFEGVVCTDWAVLTENPFNEVKAWGVEKLTPKQRAQKAIEAGVDQFGGEAAPEYIIDLVKEGKVTEERINGSVKHIMLDKFRLGLFDNPYVDEDGALKIAGRKEFREKGELAMQKSNILLKNADALLPLKQGVKIYVHGAKNPESYAKYGVLVNNPGDADVVLTRINTPFEPRNNTIIERFFHQGRLYFNDAEKKDILGLISKKPSIVVINLERPAILTEVDKESKALIAEFGVSDKVLAELLFGKANFTGKLPFDLPSSWESLQNQLEDVPFDAKNPLYRFGFGLSYGN